jgi:hypothetical protein
MRFTSARSFLVVAVGMIASIGLFAGCHSGGDSSSSSSSDSNSVAPSATTRPIPPDSIFAKVKMGEEQNDVYAAIGQPTSVSAPYTTGKQFIPFHYGGGDVTRVAAHYKGVGVITFGNDSAYTSGYSVVDITYDPNDSGN